MTPDTATAANRLVVLAADRNPAFAETWAATAPDVTGGAFMAVWRALTEVHVSRPPRPGARRSIVASSDNPLVVAAARRDLASLARQWDAASSDVTADAFLTVFEASAEKLGRERTRVTATTTLALALAAANGQPR